MLRQLQDGGWSPERPRRVYSVRVLQKNKIERICINRYVYEEICYRNWYTQLWKPWKTVICHLPGGAPEKLVVWFSPSPKAWEQGSAGTVPESNRLRTRRSNVWRLEKMESQLKREREFPPSFFCPVGALSRLDKAHPHWWGWVCFTKSTESNAYYLETPSQTHPETIFYQLSTHPLNQSSWHLL